MVLLDCTYDIIIQLFTIETWPAITSSRCIRAEDLVKLVNYGTAVPLARTINVAYDILIAYEANGEQLQPDHGFSVCLVIPGYIGGRMTK